MPRNISFMLTTEQVRSRTKTVTRRLGWLKLKKGDVLNACVKCMGLKLGQQVERIAKIEVIDVRREPLSEVTDAEAALEGFPEMTGEQFVAMFCMNMRCTPETIVTRIEYKYL